MITKKRYKIKARELQDRENLEDLCVWKIHGANFFSTKILRLLVDQ